jgi:hypothetical protein
VRDLVLEEIFELMHGDSFGNLKGKEGRSRRSKKHKGRAEQSRAKERRRRRGGEGENLYIHHEKSSRRNCFGHTSSSPNGRG